MVPTKNWQERRSQRNETERSRWPEARCPALYPGQPIRWGLGLEFMPEPDSILSGSFRTGLACKRKRTSTHARLVG